MREVIVTGKAIEDAIQEGCRQLNVERDGDGVSYEILEMPVRKLFRSIPAKVRVWVDEPEIAAVEEVKIVETVVVTEEPAAKPAVEKAEAPAAAEPVSEEPAAEEKEEKPAEEDEEEVPFEIDEDEKVKAAVEYLKTVFAAMEVTDAQFTASRKGEATIIHVSGENISVLIGRRGETMESLSYLASLVANRMGGDYMKLGLDVAGYRDKREKDLEALARRVGEKVQRTGRCFAMEPMNPYERRILHSTISKMEGLRSESKGEGSERRVVIYSTAPDAKNDVYDHERRGGGRREGERRGRSGGRGERREGGRFNGKGGYRGNKNGGRGNRSSVPGREYANRPRNTGAAPSAPVRTQRINDAEDFALFGKIEL